MPRIRPSDDTGDILPVLSVSDLSKDTDAVVREVTLRLRMLTGQWWENRTTGCAIIDMIRESRMTETDLQAISSYLSTYIAQTTGVIDVRDINVSSSGRRFLYSCTVITDTGSAPVEYTFTR